MPKPDPNSPITKLLVERGTFCVDDLAEVLGVTRRTAYHRIEAARDEGSIFITRYEGRMAMYAARRFRAQEDAPRPPPISQALKQARYRSRRKAQLKKGT